MSLGLIQPVGPHFATSVFTLSVKGEKAPGIGQKKHHISFIIWGQCSPPPLQTQTQREKMECIHFLSTLSPFQIIFRTRWVKLVLTEAVGSDTWLYM